MYDAYDSYNEGLIVMGAFITVSGLMLYPIPTIRNTIEKVSESHSSQDYQYDIYYSQRQRKATATCEIEPSIIKNNKKLEIDLPEDVNEEKTPMV